MNDDVNERRDPTNDPETSLTMSQITIRDIQDTIAVGIVVSIISCEHHKVSKIIDWYLNMWSVRAPLTLFCLHSFKLFHSFLLRLGLSRTFGLLPTTARSDSNPIARSLSYFFSPFYRGDVSIHATGASIKLLNCCCREREISTRWYLHCTHRTTQHNTALLDRMSIDKSFGVFIVTSRNEIWYLDRRLFMSKQESELHWKFKLITAIYVHYFNWFIEHSRLKRSSSEQRVYRFVSQVRSLVDKLCSPFFYLYTRWFDLMA